MTATNRILPSIFAVMTLVAVSAANATVFYDVTTIYDDGSGGLYEYSFSMEFDNATGVKYETDLIGLQPGDFQNEMFSGPDGAFWTLNTDVAPAQLLFDPTTLTTEYLSHDLFTDPNTFLSLVDHLTHYDARHYPAPLTLYTYGAINTTTKLDQSHTHQVPEPASIALMGLGLAGLGFSRRRKGKQTLMV